MPPSIPRMEVYTSSDNMPTNRAPAAWHHSISESAQNSNGNKQQAHTTAEGHHKADDMLAP